MDALKKVLELELDAEQFGFRWDNTTQIMEQIETECSEISEHLNHDKADYNQDALQEEIGDLLHAAFSLCVYCKFNPKETLTKALDKFERRMNAVKSIAYSEGLDNVDGLAFDKLMMFWAKAKEQVG